MGTAEALDVLSAAGAPGLTADELAEWMLRQRWFGAKARELGAVTIIDATLVSQIGDPLLLLIVEVRSPAGTHDLYQVPVGISSEQDRERGEVIWRDGTALYDAMADARQAGKLAQMIAGESVAGEDGSTVAFHRSGGFELTGTPSVRRVSGEQSNSSVVLDDRYILKAYRRLEAGVNPELEMLSFLAAHGFESIAPVAGWYDYSGELLDATLGVIQRFVPDGRDGWEMVLEALRTGSGDDVLEPLRELGSVTGEMHTVLACDAENTEFAPEEPSDENVALMVATIDEQIDRLFIELPDRDELGPIRTRGEELRDRLAALSHTGVGGRLIRSHGDYHLGQTLFSAGGWIVLDFEGEPGRPMRERRRKRSPLRDVAGMLRSFAYASVAGEVLEGREPSGDRGWETRSRDSFLDGYMAAVDGALLPAGMQAIEKQLAMFELEKLLYELRYELENRPNWLTVPVTGILRLLEEPLR
jgi:trehalose synthase-fused probable maltokinase